jgi:hypothetical protein
MKHLENTFAIYVLKHMQHPDRTLATYNMKTLATTEDWNR